MSTLTTGEVLDMAMTPGKSPDLDVQVNGYRAKLNLKCSLAHKTLLIYINVYTYYMVISGGTSIINFSTSLILTNNNGVPLKSSK